MKNLHLLLSMYPRAVVTVTKDPDGFKATVQDVSTCTNADLETAIDNASREAINTYLFGKK